ncbi:SGNH/GDSL hydrolase family protein [candidate division KSB1 bacterium]|nr:SGNH/GDSL hydrolase family protein [candidate division KSB1 bacterium]
MWSHDTAKKPAKLYSFRAAFFIVILLASGLLFGMAEGLTRLLWGDRINLQYTTRHLFQKGFYAANTNGWVPHATGSCAGARVTINALGLRGPEINLRAKEEKILLLGDSVLFGPSVEEQETIAELLRASLQACIVNAAVIGHNTSDYVEVLRYWKQKTALARAVVFLCLNDVQNDTSTVQDLTLTKNLNRLLAQLRAHSKFYMLLKNTVSDRSQVYFSHDQQFYQPHDARFQQAIKDLAVMQALCSEMNVRFDVVLLPYEYQLRNSTQPGVWSPQELLQEQVRALKINCLAIDFSSFYGSRSKELYLYADGIHLSKLGHQLVAEQVSRYLGPVGYSTKIF